MREVVKKAHGDADVWSMTNKARARTFAVVGGAALCLALLAPIAHAQVGDLSGTVGTVTDTVGGVTGGGGGGSTSGGTLTDTVDSVTDPVGGGTSDTSDTSDPLEGVKKTVGETVDTTNETVKETTSDPTQTVTDTVGGVANEVNEKTGGTLDPVTNTVTGLAPKDGKTKAGTTQSGPAGNRTARTREPAVLGTSFADALRADSKIIASGTSPALRDVQLASSVTAAADSLAEQIGAIARAAADQMAFPALLIVIVIGFLMVQNHIDRRDPKLAMAPVDSEHDLLSFS